MRMRALWAGALLSTALASAVIGPLTASTADDGNVIGTIWVANRSPTVNADTIRAFDAATGDLKQEIHMAPGSQPGDLAVAKGKVYVAEERGGAPGIAIVDPESASGEITRIPTGPGSRPHHVHASAGGNLLAVGLFGTDDVAVIDTHDDAIIGRWDVDPANESGRIHAGIFSNDESTLYLANEAGNQVIAMDPRNGTVFWRLAVPAVHELAVSHNQKLLYVSRRGANRLAVVHLDPDVWVKPEKYVDVLALDLPDSLQLSANEEVLTVGLRLPPARMAIVDTRLLQPCDAAGVCDSSSVTHAVLDEAQATNSIGGHQWTSPSGRYTWASFEGPGAGVVLIDHSNPGKPVKKLSYAGQPHGVDRSHP